MNGSGRPGANAAAAAATAGARSKPGAESRDLPRTRRPDRDPREAPLEVADARREPPAAPRRAPDGARARPRRPSATRVDRIEGRVGQSLPQRPRAQGRARPVEKGEEAARGGAVRRFEELERGDRRRVEAHPAVEGERRPAPRRGRSLRAASRLRRPGRGRRRHGAARSPLPAGPSADHAASRGATGRPGTPATGALLREEDLARAGRARGRPRRAAPARLPRGSARSRDPGTRRPTPRGPADERREVRRGARDERFGVEDGPRGHDPRDVPADEPLRCPRVLDLVADRDLAAGGHELGDVMVDGLVRARRTSAPRCRSRGAAS